MGIKFSGMTSLEMFVDTWIRITKVNKYFVGIINSWIALPLKCMKLNVQQKLFFYSKLKYYFIHKWDYL